MRNKERLCGMRLLDDQGVAAMSPDWILIICFQSLELRNGDARGQGAY